MSRKGWQITGSYVPLRLEMLESPAWQAAPRAMKEWLEVLSIEHMRHKGCANGQLFKSYRQFIAAGFNRNTVAEMSRVAEAHSHAPTEGLMMSQYQKCYRTSTRTDTHLVPVGVLSQYQKCYYLLYSRGVHHA